MAVGGAGPVASSPSLLDREAKRATPVTIVAGAAVAKVGEIEQTLRRTRTTSQRGGAAVGAPCEAVQRSAFEARRAHVRLLFFLAPSFARLVPWWLFLAFFFLSMRDGRRNVLGGACPLLFQIFFSGCSRQRRWQWRRRRRRGPLALFPCGGRASRATVLFTTTHAGSSSPSHARNVCPARGAQRPCDKGPKKRCPRGLTP